MATGNRKAYEDSEELHWWVDLTEEDRNSKEPKPKPKKDPDRGGDLAEQRRRHNDNERVDAVILGG